MAAPRLLTLMGSGETTATMVPVHRAVFERFPGRPLLAVLDTPYGFQENADELTGRAVDYFRTSLPMAEIAVASLRSSRDPASRREEALDTLRRADVVFSGPGSPSYALRVWKATPVPSIMARKLASGGALTMASAASVTLGRFALPVYEIYKVGADPAWLEGLDLLGPAGLVTAIVPHWDNAEGGTHDTSRCWLGERRFNALVSRLPAGALVLGIDEHTACLLDLEAGRLEVAGRGTVTLLTGADPLVLGPGEALPLPSPGPSLEAGATPGRVSPPPAPPAVSPPPAAPASAYEEAFLAALDRGDTGAALDAILSLEDAHQGWEPAAAAMAHTALRGMATRFAHTMTGLTLDAHARAAAVEALLGVRSRARDEGRWADADAIRRALSLLAVEVRDTPGGPVWEAVGP